MSDIEIGSVWVGKTSNDIDCTVLSVMDNEVKVECIDRGNWFYYPVYDFLSMYKLKDDKADMVNHPPHYKDASGIECIEVTKHMQFCGGNCFKYLYRAASAYPTASTIWGNGIKLRPISCLSCFFRLQFSLFDEENKISFSVSTVKDMKFHWFKVNIDVFKL